jgi:hypothetical protein
MNPLKYSVANQDLCKEIFAQAILQSISQVILQPTAQVILQPTAQAILQ